MAIDKADIKLGFWVAAGFALFGLVLGIIQWLISRARRG